MTDLNPAEIDLTFKRDVDFCAEDEQSPEGPRRSISCSSSEWSSESEGTPIVERPKQISASINRGVQEGDTVEDQEFNEPSNGGDCQKFEAPQETDGRRETPQRVTHAPEEIKFQQRCSKCGADISSLHYLEQVKHAKQCISRRKGDGEVGGARHRNQSGLLSKDIRDWLKELDLEPYTDRFLAEEVDMSIVHVLDEEDLKSLGIVDRILQIRFIQAARIVGKEREKIKRGKWANSKGDRNQQSHVASPRLKQQKLRIEKLGGSINCRAGPPSDNKNIHSPRVKGIQEERHLLSMLYPVQQWSDNQRRDNGDKNSDDARVNVRPQLATTFRIGSLVEPSASLFTAAALCKQVTVPLEERLEKRLADKSNDDSGDCVRARQPESLERGGRQYHVVHEDRATKLLKLEALQQELAAHESTVAELKRLISQLQDELKAERSCAAGIE